MQSQKDNLRKRMIDLKGMDKMRLNWKLTEGLVVDEQSFYDNCIRDMAFQR